MTDARESTTGPFPPDPVTSYESAAPVAGGAGSGGPSTGTGSDGGVAGVSTVMRSWRGELEGRTSLPATEVQDRLLDLWGTLPDGDIRVAIERWITETLERNLYQTGDVESRLEGILAEAGQGAAR